MTVVGVYAETDPNNYSGKDLVILAPYTVATIVSPMGSA